MNIKTFLLGAAASILVAGAAAAADLPSFKAPPVYAPPPAFSWEGFHFGVNGGYGGGSVDSYSTLLAPPVVIPPVGFAASAQSSRSISGGIVGFQSGYLWQFSNNVVLGYESDIQWSGVRSSAQNGAFNFANVQNRLSWFATERVRAGYAFGRFLPYVTGGLAYGRVRATAAQAAGAAVYQGYGSSTRAGFAVGAGAEYALTNNLSVKAEYLYVELQGVHGAGAGVTSVAAFPVAFGQFRTGRYGTHIARAGLNYTIDMGTIGRLIGISGL